MRVINHNWSAMKQRPHPQSVAEISRHSVLSWDRIRQCETSSGSRHKDISSDLERPLTLMSRSCYYVMLNISVMVRDTGNIQVTIEY